MSKLLKVLASSVAEEKLTALVLNEVDQKLYYIDSCRLPGFDGARLGYETMAWEAGCRTLKPKDWGKPVIEMRFSMFGSMMQEHERICDHIEKYINKTA